MRSGVEQDGVWALGLPGWCTGLEQLAASSWEQVKCHKGKETWVNYML